MDKYEAIKEAIIPLTKKWSSIIRVLPVFFYRNTDKHLNSLYKFEDIDRELQNPSSYPNSLLSAFVKVIGVSTADFIHAAKVGTATTQDTVRSRIKRLVNKKINEPFHNFYQTESIYLDVHFNHGTITFTVQSEEGEALSLGERSNGLRWYLETFIDSQANGIPDRNVVYLFDEPGISLHVKAQEKLLELFGHLADSGNQVVYTTHSPHNFFGWTIISDRSRALDFRAYRQDKICADYLASTDGYSWNSVSGKKARGICGIMWGTARIVDKLFIGVIYGYVCLKAWAGAFGIGSVTQYIAAITALSRSVSLLLELLGRLRNNVSYLETTFEFLDLPHEMYQGSLTTEKRSDRQYQVEFRDVSFKYPGSDQWALRHVNMKFEVGRRFAVVGQNGSGKTTFIKLLCRLYDTTEGQILLNGIDIRKYNYQDYLDIFSVVFQDFQLLAFTLGENVAAAKDYDAARAEDCLRKAGFGDRLDRLPDGLNTYLYREFSKQGVEISGGEAQKIAIARALYADAPFIILDEPTAALDPIAEAEIYSKFDEIAGDKTAIYISHRLSSCRFCDDILVFDQGQVIQQGSHEELLADGTGKYYALWHAQAQYYTKT